MDSDKARRVLGRKIEGGRKGAGWAGRLKTRRGTVVAGAEGEMFQVEEPGGPQLRAGKRLAFSGTEGRSGGRSVVRRGCERRWGWGAGHRVWQQVEAKTVAVFSPEPTKSCQAQADNSAPPQCDAVKNGSGRGWRVTTFPLPGALGLSRRCV